MAVDLQVIGVGLGRTGTNSLKLALEQLGFGPCYHMSEVFQHPERARRWQDRAAGELVPWEELLQGYRAAVDWPPVYFWRELVRDFPQAKVILSTRDAGRWYASLDATIHQALKASPPLSSSRRRSRELRGEAALEAREERDALREVGGHPPSSQAAQASLGASAA